MIAVPQIQSEWMNEWITVSVILWVSDRTNKHVTLLSESLTDKLIMFGRGYLISQLPDRWLVIKQVGVCVLWEFSLQFLQKCLHLFKRWIEFYNGTCVFYKCSCCRTGMDTDQQDKVCCRCVLWCLCRFTWNRFSPILSGSTMVQ